MVIAEDTSRVIYRSAEWYDRLYPQSKDWAIQSLQIARAHVQGPIESVLDIGCGTGQAMEQFATSGASVRGIDILPTMVEAARRRCPAAEVAVADMRSLALDETFDIVLSLGSVFAHALTDADVRATLETMARVTRPDGLLLLHVLNGAAILTGTVRPEDLSVGAHARDGTYHGQATGTICLENSRLRLTREWRRDGEFVSREQVEIRLMMPIEFRNWLGMAGFDVIAIADNADLRPSALDGERLWILARRRLDAA
ncbi:MAG: class I SAM-dependent methyltransferase [Rhizobium sp.]